MPAGKGLVPTAERPGRQGIGRSGDRGGRERRSGGGGSRERGSRERGWGEGGSRERGSGERGSGTVLVAGVVFVLMAVTAAILVVGGYLVAADRARGAADLVAVSAAAEQAGLGPGCRVAAGIARLNGVELVRCVVEGDSLDFVVTVTVRQPVRVRLPLLPGEVLATSHAGRLGVMSRG